MDPLPLERARALPEIARLVRRAVAHMARRWLDRTDFLTHSSQVKVLRFVPLVAVLACSRPTPPPPLTENPKLSAHFSAQLAHKLEFSTSFNARKLAPAVSRVTVICELRKTARRGRRLDYTVITQQGRELRGRATFDCASDIEIVEVSFLAGQRLVVKTSGEERGEAYSDLVADRPLSDLVTSLEAAGEKLDEAARARQPQPTPSQAAESWK